MTTYDTDFQSEPTCPECGHAHDDWGELYANEGPDSTIEMDCENCGGEFKSEISTIWAFTTWVTA